MKCPECVKQGVKSVVQVGAGTSTLMYCPSYYDEEGVYHNHDLNKHTASFSCSNGHEWVETYFPECPAGDYPQKN